MKGNNILRILLAVIAISVIAIMTYLVILHYSPDKGSFCDLGEGLSCGLVNKSRYSVVFGMPVSGLGLLYFVLALWIALFKYSSKNIFRLGFLTLVFLGPSLYLSYIEYFVIESVCVLCEASKVLMLIIFALALFAMRPKRFDIRVINSGVLLALLLTGATYLTQQAGAVPSGTYDTFAKCLYDSGVREYGSKGCSFCARQRDLFGDSHKFIKEIECNPNYKNSEVERCVEKNIEHTPTWILEDTAGNEIKRLPSGAVSLQGLSEFSGCPLTKDTKE